LAVAVTNRNKPDLFEDYATEPVPRHIRVKGNRIALINCGLALSLTGLILGVDLGASLGLIASAVAFVSSGAALGFRSLKKSSPR